MLTQVLQVLQLAHLWEVKEDKEEQEVKDNTFIRDEKSIDINISNVFISLNFFISPNDNARTLN
jgi:hypothetical protein